FLAVKDETYGFDTRRLPPQLTKKRRLQEETEEGDETDISKKRQNTETVKIFNLSTQDLSAEDVPLLSKGLNFTPSAHPNPFTLFVDLNKFVRNLTVKRYYNKAKGDPGNNGYPQHQNIQHQ
ncbi:hypothetical protein AB205_0188640, partial [Aquarana catesbeiana]